MFKIDTSSIKEYLYSTSTNRNYDYSYDEEKRYNMAVALEPLYEKQKRKNNLLEV